MEKLNPDTDKSRMVAREQLGLRQFQEGFESMDELARYLERLLDRSSPGLPAETRETELRFHLMNSFPEKVAFQLKVSPKGSFAKTISKAREILLIYSRVKTDPVSLIQPTEQHEVCLDRLKESLQQMTNLQDHRQRCYEPRRIN